VSREGAEGVPALHRLGDGEAGEVGRGDLRASGSQEVHVFVEGLRPPVLGPAEVARFAEGLLGEALLAGGAPREDFAPPAVYHVFDVVQHGLHARGDGVGRVAGDGGDLEEPVLEALAGHSVEVVDDDADAADREVFGKDGFAVAGEYRPPGRGYEGDSHLAPAGFLAVEVGLEDLHEREARDDQGHHDEDHGRDELEADVEHYPGLRAASKRREKRKKT